MRVGTVGHACSYTLRHVVTISVVMGVKRVCLWPFVHVGQNVGKASHGSRQQSLDLPADLTVRHAVASAGW